MSDFMRPEVTQKQFGYRVETRDGTFYVPSDVCGFVSEVVDFELALNLSMYVPSSFGVDDVERVSGYFGRLSAPGCLDCTDWEFGTNKRQLERDLKRQLAE